jgi:hydrogenase maturation protein HypF
LAVGGDLKCAPALASGERVWLAPHLGDLADPRIQARLTAGLAELQARQARPLQAIACDRHPAYRSHQLAAAHAATTGTPLLTVQHHAAHALAVIAEHGLQTPLLAFCADGLGYGEASGDDPDRQPQPPLWGGELLGIGAQRIERLAALRPLPLVGGERACLEPRRVALGLLASAGPWALAHRGAARSLAAFPANDRALLLQLLEQGLHCPWTSSLGRLFDGVASLLGVCQRLSYEGEAALRLQGLASRQGAWAEADHCGAAHPFPRSAAPAVGQETLPLGWIDWEPALAALLAERAAGVPRRISAARFHRGLADALGELLTSAAATRGCRVVVLAGGCFQNALLLEALIRRLRRSGLEPHWAAAVPPNDGGLALGQLEALRRASRRAV